MNDIFELDENFIANRMVDYLRLKGPGHSLGYKLRIDKTRANHIFVYHDHKIALTESELVTAKLLADAFATGFVTAQEFRS